MSEELKTLIEHWVRPDIRALSAYHVQNSSGMTKLDAMENPYTWPDELRDEWTRVVRNTDVNRYPDPLASELASCLSDVMQVPAGMRVMLGNGSDEIIQMIVMSLSGPGRCVLSVEPGFVMYRMIATFCGMPYIGVPLRSDDFSLDLAAIKQAMEQHQPAVVFLAYPNNPTGNLYSEQDIIAIIRAAPGLVVIDEAYAPFTNASFMSRLGEFPNLIVMRTLSKMGLAGLRLGFLAGPDAWLAEFDKVRLPYNINVLTQVSAEFALRHKAVFDQQTTRICEQREFLLGAFAELPGVTVYSSAANFILLRTPKGQASAWFEEIKQRGILIKNLSAGHALLTDCLRVTVGTPEENQRMLAVFAEIAGA